MNREAIFKDIKSAFCSLVNWKDRGETIEIITPLVTLDNKFISVFLTERKNELIVTDGGWIKQEYYGNLYLNEPNELSERIINQLIFSFKIRTHKTPAGEIYYYKKSTPTTVANDCFDVANFITQVINSGKINYTDQKDAKERELFRHKADAFLFTKYNERLNVIYKFDGLPSIKFNAAISNNAGLYLINYITGSTPFAFANDLRKCIVNFEMIMRTSYKNQVKKRFALVNDESPGFATPQSETMYGLLKDHSSGDIIPWKKKEEIFTLIP